MPYEFNGFIVRDDMLEALNAYVWEGKRPGGFLTAVISNDLTGACARADSSNICNLPAFAGWLYNEAPGPSWGSPEKMEAWIARFEKKPDEAVIALPYAGDARGVVGVGYPPGWPTCPGCGGPALDGHKTCGNTACRGSSDLP